MARKIRNLPVRVSRELSNYAAVERGLPRVFYQEYEEYEQKRQEAPGTRVAFCIALQSRKILFF